jgi:hypothetical protein
MLTEEDQEKRNKWLAIQDKLAFKNLVYVGDEVTKLDVERWLRDALGISPPVLCGKYTISSTQGLVKLIGA